MINEIDWKKIGMNEKIYELIAKELRFQHEALKYNAGKIEGNGGNNTTNVYEMSCKLWAKTLEAESNTFNRLRFLIDCGIYIEKVGKNAGGTKNYYYEINDERTT